MNTENFLKELEKILSTFPKTTPEILNSENSEYGDKIYYSKNLSFSFDCANCADSEYLYDSYLTTNCVDCDYCVESELCYECVDGFKCFNSNYLENCSKLRDSWYSYNCINCTNVFGCANLQNKSFCLFNRQLTESEYKEKIREYEKLPAEKILKHLKELKEKYPYTQTNEAHNENSEYGNYVYYCKNCYLTFDSAHNEDSSYLYDSFYNKTCYDMTYGSQNNELSYEIIDSGKMFNCNFAFRSNNCQDSYYIFNCTNVRNCIGCVSLTNKEYCILNRQFTKEEYERIKSNLLTQITNEKIGWNNLKTNS